MRSITLLFALVSVLAVPTVASADKDDGKMDRHAKIQFDRALELYTAGKYREAADAFYRAYKVEKRDDILFGWAQSKRLSGNCKGAVKLYRKLLRHDLPEADEKAVREGLEACGAKVKKSRASDDEERASDSEAASEDDDEEEADDRDDSDDSSEEEEGDEEEDDQDDDKAAAASVKTPRGPSTGGSPWYTDIIGDAMLVTGVVGLGIGTGYFLVSSSDRSAADEATNYESYNTLADRASTRRTIAILVTSGSAALITGAVVRYIMRDNGAESAATVSAWRSSNGAGIGVGGRF